MSNREELNHFFVSCFNSILRAEERALESLTNGTLSIKEIHFIEAVFEAQKRGENCFSTIADFLGVTYGTLTTSFSRLEKKGYLAKVQDEDDKRIHYIVPTALAELINKEHTAFHERMVDSVAENLSEKQFDELVKSLHILDDFFAEY